MTSHVSLHPSEPNSRQRGPQQRQGYKPRKLPQQRPSKSSSSSGTKRTLLRATLLQLERRSNSARIAGSEAQQAIAEASAQKQVVERELEQQQNMAERLARDLAFLRTEHGATQALGSEAARAAAALAEQKLALEQELEQQRDKAEVFARDLASLRTEHEAAKTSGSEAVGAAAAMAEQKRALEQELEQQRDKAEILARDLASVRAELDTARLAGLEAAQAAAAGAEQNQALERELKQQRERAGAASEQKIAGASERDRADALGRELALLRIELDNPHGVAREAARSVEAAKIEHEQALKKERNRAETLARELASARMQADERSTRLAAAYAELLQVTETSRVGASEQKTALAAERDRADALARELASVRDQLDSHVRSDAANAAVVEVEQRQALENELKQQRDGPEALARELALLRAELDNAHGVAREAARSVEAAKIEHEQALEKERDRAETLARELASARMQAGERSARLAAAYAEVQEVTDASRVSAWEQKTALVAERDRADTVARELASVRHQLDAGNRRLAALKAFQGPAAVDGLPEWVATSRSVTTEGTLHHPQQASMQAAAFYQEPSSTAEGKPPAAQSAARERGPVLEFEHRCGFGPIYAGTYPAPFPC